MENKKDESVNFKGGMKRTTEESHRRDGSKKQTREGRMVRECRT